MMLSNNNPGHRGSGANVNILDRFTHFDKQADAEAWIITVLQRFSEFFIKNTTCAVLDIDGTILKDRDNEDLKPLCIHMIYNIFKMCHKMEIPIFVITARPEGREQRKWTVDQLDKCGYPPSSYVELRMMPNSEWRKQNVDPNWNFSEYKYNERQRIVQKYNKTIILNAGDQWTDLLRVPPCSKSVEESETYKQLQNLPNKGVYVGSLVDLSWISIKLPH